MPYDSDNSSSNSVYSTGSVPSVSLSDRMRSIDVQGTLSRHKRKSTEAAALEQTRRMKRRHHHHHNSSDGSSSSSSSSGSDDDDSSDDDSDSSDDDDDDIGVRQEELIEQMLSRRVAAAADDSDSSDDDDDDSSDDDDEQRGGDHSGKLLRYLKKTVFRRDGDDSSGEDDDDGSQHLLLLNEAGRSTTTTTSSSSSSSRGGDDSDSGNNNYRRRRRSGSRGESGTVELSDLLASLKDGPVHHHHHHHEHGDAAVVESREVLAMHENLSSLKKIAREKSRGDVHRELADDLLQVQEQRAAFDMVDEQMEKWHPVVSRLEQARHIPLSYRDGDRSVRRNQLSKRRPAVIDAFDHEIERKMERQRLMSRGTAANDSDQQRDEGPGPAGFRPLSATTLQKKQFTREEMMARAQDLRQRRVAMQREHEKFARLKKIKSKTYRKILKRQREKEEQRKREMEDLDQLDPEELEQRLLKEERAMLRERMTMKHKNKSSWVRRALKMHHHNNEDLNRAVAEQLRIGEELRKRQTQYANQDSDEEDDIVESMFRDGEEARNTIESLRKDTVGGGGDGEAETGLFGMAFMRRARERQRQQQMDLIAQIEKDVRDEQRRMDGSDDEDSRGSDESDGDTLEGFGRRKFTSVSEVAQRQLIGDIRRPVGKQQQQQQQAKSSGSTTLIATAGPLDVQDVHDGTLALNSTQIDESLNPNVRRGQQGQQQQQDSDTSAAKPARSKKRALFVVETGDMASRRRGTASRQSRGSIAGGSGTSNDEKDGYEGDESNPWLQQTEAAFKDERASKRQKKDKKHDEREIKLKVTSLLEDENDQDEADRSRQQGSHDDNNANDDDGDDEAAMKMKQFVQEVKKQAFAEDDIELEFGTEKQRTIDMEIDLPDLDTAIKPGWGDWAGKGTEFKEKHEKRLQEVDKIKDRLRKEKSAERPDRHKAHVIIRETAALPQKYLNTRLPIAKDSVRKIYDTAQAHPIGHEWNSYLGMKRTVRPRVQVKSGSVVAPLSYKKAHKAVKRSTEREREEVDDRRRLDPVEAEAERIKRSYEAVKRDRMRERMERDSKKFESIQEKQRQQEIERLIV